MKIAFALCLAFAGTAQAADFDQIAAVTGQRMYWVADPGSID